MSATSEIKFELYIDSTSTGDTANLNPEDMTDVGLNEGITINESGGGITFDGAGNIKCGKTGYDVGIGWWLGFDEAARKCRVAIGDPNNEKVTWDGQDLVIDIDGTNLSVNGGNTGQVLKVASNGTVEFGNNVETLDDLTDVTGTTHTSGTFKVLVPKTGNVYGFEDLRSVTSSYVRLQDLSNVTNTAPTATGLFLRYNASNQQWEYDTASDVGADIAIGNLSDVNITSIANDQVLQYNSATAKFENVDMTTAIGNQGLGDHTDVSLSGLQVTRPKVLWQHASYNSGNWVARTLSLAPVTFNNVVGTLGQDKILVYNVPGGATDPHWAVTAKDSFLSLDDLTDVNASSPSPDQFLQYNGTNWVATSRSMFSTIAVSGQSNVVADSPTDTLTLAAGTGITLTTDANTDTITIASSGSGGSGSSDVIQDADGDTKVQVEAATDNDEVRLIQAGNQLVTLRSSKVGLGTFSSNPQYMVDMREGAASAQMRLFTLGTSTNTILRNEIGGTTGSNFIYFGDSGDADIGKIQYNHTDNDMIFTTNAAENIRLISEGGITFGGETTTAHALDDYEEGTWTPHFADAQSGGNYVTAGTAGTGSFTKIGNIVHISCPAQNINPSGLTSSNFLYVRNFPFTVANTYLQVPSTSVNFASRANTNQNGSYFQLYPGGTYGFIVRPADDDSTSVNENIQTVGNILRTTQTGNQYTAVRFSLTYIAA